jgi:hypothetical protein
MKQQGLAMHNKADKNARRGDNFFTQLSYIKSPLDSSNVAQPWQDAYSHWTMILPFGEEQAVYDALQSKSVNGNFSSKLADNTKGGTAYTDLTGAANANTVAVSIDWLICPSWTGNEKDTAGAVVGGDTLGTGGKTSPNAKSTYRGSAGTNRGGSTDGGIGTLSEIGFASFTDGTSTTIQLTENARAGDFSNGKKNYFWWGPGGTPAQNPALGTVTPGGDTSKYNQNSVTTAHTGGLFGVTFADGSSRFLNYNIDPATFTALLTRNGAEQITTEY